MSGSSLEARGGVGGWVQPAWARLGTGAVQLAVTDHRPTWRKLACEERDRNDTNPQGDGKCLRTCHGGLREQRKTQRDCGRKKGGVSRGNAAGLARVLGAAGRTL